MAFSVLLPLWSRIIFYYYLAFCCILYFRSVFLLCSSRMPWLCSKSFFFCALSLCLSPIAWLFLPFRAVSCFCSLRFRLLCFCSRGPHASQYSVSLCLSVFHQVHLCSRSVCLYVISDYLDLLAPFDISLSLSCTMPSHFKLHLSALLCSFSRFCDLPPPPGLSQWPYCYSNSPSSGTFFHRHFPILPSPSVL